MSEKNQKVEAQLKIIELVHKETIEALNSQRIIIGLFVALSGALMPASAHLYSTEKSWASGIVLVVSGLTSSLLFMYWAGEFLKISRSSLFCWEAENIIKAENGFENLALYESWLRFKGEDGRDNFILLPYMAVQTMLVIFSLLQILAGTWILHSQTENICGKIFYAFLLLIVAVIDVYGSVKIIKSKKSIRVARNKIPC
ncbi:hypothetical protein ACCD06_01010 [Azospirillum sp. CT11-132]|uniref:hypothetical protein n=1 Tax=Azospirillum sp. CT11-132 TaxID=3396317 RepID=UPI0039A7841C